MKNIEYVNHRLIYDNAKNNVLYVFSNTIDLIQIDKEGIDSFSCISILEKIRMKRVLDTDYEIYFVITRNNIADIEEIDKSKIIQRTF